MTSVQFAKHLNLRKYLAEAGFPSPPEEPEQEPAIAAPQVGCPLLIACPIVLSTLTVIKQPRPYATLPALPAHAHSRRCCTVQTAEIDPWVAAVFARLDTDGSGALGYSSLARLLEVLNLSSTRADVEQLLFLFGRALSDDDNGQAPTIDINEFHRLASHLNIRAKLGDNWIHAISVRAPAALAPSPPPPEEAAPAAETSALAALLARGAHTVSMSEAFQACDVDGDGVLNEVEVSGLVSALGYDVDAAYLGGVLNIFGKFDTDRNGFIELREFGALWKHLQGPVLAADEPSALATPRAAGAGQAAVAAAAASVRAPAALAQPWPPPPPPPPEEAAPAALAPPAPAAETSALAALLARGAHTVSMSEAFQACDVDGDGVLNEVEVSGLVGSLGYDVDAAYLGGVLNIFGKFDTDRNGFIELREFGALWKHLQGPVLAADEPSALANSRVTMPVELDAVATPAVQSSTTTEVVSQSVGAWAEDRRGRDIPEGVPPSSSLQPDTTHATPSSSFFNDFIHPSEIAEQRELSLPSSTQPHPGGGVGSTLFADPPQQAGDNDDAKPAGRSTNSISFGRDTVQLYLATFPPYRCCENSGLADIRLLHL
eukprot:COSAG01_NODE_897_length_12874_cov_17.636115_9_plen_602_part_00